MSSADQFDDVDALVAGARLGQPREIARLISLIENDTEAVRPIVARLGAMQRARVVGITGAPGVGKSTLTSALVSALRRRGERVGVIAVDPSSPFTGGALLGDRIRMQGHATDPGVFIRSMASRGHLGGLAATTGLAVRVLDAAGFDTVLIETVGVGQSEVQIAAAADSTVVALAPGMGDAVQAAKAGVLEIGDILVVNKADREGAEATARELRQMVALGRREEQWTPPVLATVASSGTGIDDLLAALDEHAAWLEQSGRLAARRRRRVREEIEAIATGQLRGRIMAAGLLEGLSDQVSRGELDPFAAADQLVAALR